MKRIAILLSCLSMSLLFAAGAQEATQANTPITLHVYADSSLQPCMDALLADFGQSHPGVVATGVYGQSDALCREIEMGADADVFLPMGPDAMAPLVKKGLVVDATLQDLLENKVVQVVPAQAQVDAGAHAQVVSDVPVGNGPVGPASQQLFNALGNAQGSTGSGVAADIITTGPTDNPEMEIYPVAVVKASLHVEQARKLVDYLYTPKAISVFGAYGFTVL